MASGESWPVSGCYSPRIVCPGCDKPIEILNGDAQFSLEVHMQSHKSLEMIAQGLDKPLKEAQTGSKFQQKGNSNYKCPDCKEHVEILNNDVRLSLQLHLQKHKSCDAETRSEDQASTSRRKRRKSKNPQTSNVTDNNVKSKPKAQSVQTGILDDIFNEMPPGLKSHRGFVIENGSSEAFCNICNMKIEPIFSIPEHFKTKAHEDNAILFLKEKLSVDLHQMMEFVSFYGSSLYCNLCSCKINLCSNNPYETIVNIMSHNAGKDHFSKKTNNLPSHQFDQSQVTLEYLASINTLINGSKHLICCKTNTQLQFTCKLCDKQLGSGKTTNKLLKGFIDHLSSTAHSRCVKVFSILKSFKESNTPGKEKHNFIASKGSIACSVCKCAIEAKIEKLILHVKEANIVLLNSIPSDLVSSLDKLCIGPSVDKSNNVQPPILKHNFIENGTQIPAALPSSPVIKALETFTRNVVDLKALSNSLPKPLRNNNCLATNDQGQITCLICNCLIPANTLNLETHLTGKNHKKNEQSVNILVASTSQNKITLPETRLVSEYPLLSSSALAIDQVLNVLSKSSEKIALNREVFKEYNDGKHCVCTLCSLMIPTSSDVTTLKQRILSHIESNGHEHRLKVLKELTPLLLTSTNSLLIELFKMLPLYLQNSIEFIKGPSDGMLYCSICYLKLSPTSLQQHLEGRKHLTTMSFNTTCQSGITTSNSDVDVLFANIIKSDEIIKSGETCLMKKDKHYFCKLCESPITMSYEEQLFKDNLLTHLKGQKHKKNIRKVLGRILDKLKLSHMIIGANKNFLEKREENLYCTLCACSIKTSTEEENIKRNLVSHLLGSDHINKSRLK